MYQDEGNAQTSTGMGKLATRAFMQQRQGSSRVNWVWSVPTLKFLPARIEQRRNGEVNSAFTLQRVQGIPTGR